jgi:hypothetical protein
VRYVHLPGSAVDTALLEDGELGILLSPLVGFWVFRRTDGLDSDEEGGSATGVESEVRVEWDTDRDMTWLRRRETGWRAVGFLDEDAWKLRAWGRAFPQYFCLGCNGSIGHAGIAFI